MIAEWGIYTDSHNNLLLRAAITIIEHLDRNNNSIQSMWGS